MLGAKVEIKVEFSNDKSLIIDIDATNKDADVHFKDLKGNYGVSISGEEVALLSPLFSSLAKCLYEKWI